MTYIHKDRQTGTSEQKEKDRNKIREHIQKDRHPDRISKNRIIKKDKQEGIKTDKQTWCKFGSCHVFIERETFFFFFGAPQSTLSACNCSFVRLFAPSFIFFSFLLGSLFVRSFFFFLLGSSFLPSFVTSFSFCFFLSFVLNPSPHFLQAKAEGAHRQKKQEENFHRIFLIQPG